MMHHDITVWQSLAFLVGKVFEVGGEGGGEREDVHCTSN